VVSVVPIILHKDNAMDIPPIITTPNGKPLCREMLVSTYPRNHIDANHFCSPATLITQLKLESCKIVSATSP
jgi:hypothetical protein